MSHGLETINYKPGHKHQWLIQYKTASSLLKKYAKKYNYSLEYTSFYVTLPKSLVKKFIYKVGLFFLPLHLQMNNFCMVFKKNKIALLKNYRNLKIYSFFFGLHF